MIDLPHYPRYPKARSLAGNNTFTMYVRIALYLWDAYGLKSCFMEVLVFVIRGENKSVYG